MADQLQEATQSLLNATGSATGAAQQVAQALLQAAKASGSNANAATATAAELSNLSNRAQATQQGFNQLGSSVVGAVNGLTSVTMSVYGADKAFTALVPTIDFMVQTMKGVLSSLGTFSEGLSIGGVNIGKFIGGVSQATIVALDFSATLLKAGLDMSQKLVDAMNSATKAGALFGGSITELHIVSRQAKIPIQEMTRVITGNIEQLSKLGLKMDDASMKVAGLAGEILSGENGQRHLNDQVFALYGTFQDLAKGTADYLSLQAMSGKNTLKNTMEQRAGLLEYLYRQKELSAITGKNADTLKREEEARRNQLDYNLKAGRLNETARQNLAEAIEIAGKIGDEAGKKYAEEYFATGGKIYSKEAREYEAAMSAQADTIRATMDNIKKPAAEFRQSTTAVIKNNLGMMKSEAERQEEMVETNRAANNRILTMSGQSANAMVKNTSFLENLEGNYDKLGRDAEERGKKDSATQAALDAERKRLLVQSQIDDTAIKAIQNMGPTIEALNKATLTFINMQSEALTIFQRIISNGMNFGGDINNLSREIQRLLTEASTRASRSIETGPETAEDLRRRSEAERQRAARQPEVTQPRTPAQSNPTGPNTPPATTTPRPESNNATQNEQRSENREIQPESDKDRLLQAQTTERAVDAILRALATLPTKQDLESSNDRVVTAVTTLADRVAT